MNMKTNKAITQLHIYIVCVALGLSFAFKMKEKITQGGWDLKYLSIKSIKKYAGDEVMLDFKSSENDVDYFGKNVRLLLAKNDTVEVYLNGESTSLIEDWRIYPDQGILKDQRLISENGKIEVVKVKFKSEEKNILFLEAEVLNKNEGATSLAELKVEKEKVKGFLISSQ